MARNTLYRLGQSDADVGQSPVWNGTAWVPGDVSGGLPVGGTTGQVLTKQSGTDGDADWETPSGGGGLGYAFPLDVPPTTPHAKDDEFTGSSLDAKWTNPLTSASGQTVTVVVENSVVTIEPATAGSGNTGKHAFGIRQASPTGSFTASAKLADNVAGDDVRGGLFVAVGGAKGHVVGPFQQDGSTGYIGVTTVSDTADWSGYDGSLQTAPGSSVLATWARLVWDASTSTIKAYLSQNGLMWKLVTTRTSMSQPTEIGLVIYSNSGAIHADQKIACDWFRITEP